MLVDFGESGLGFWREGKRRGPNLVPEGSEG
jgi:hypothetical protein